MAKGCVYQLPGRDIPQSPLVHYTSFSEVTIILQWCSNCAQWKELAAPCPMDIWWWKHPTQPITPLPNWPVTWQRCIHADQNMSTTQHWMQLILTRAYINITTLQFCDNLHANMDLNYSCVCHPSYLYACTTRYIKLYCTWQQDVQISCWDRPQAVLIAINVSDLVRLC